MGCVLVAHGVFHMVMKPSIQPLEIIKEVGKIQTKKMETNYLYIKIIKNATSI
jgi:hypothetical protein